MGMHSIKAAASFWSRVFGTAHTQCSPKFSSRTFGARDGCFPVVLSGASKSCARKRIKLKCTACFGESTALSFRSVCIKAANLFAQTFSYGKRYMVPILVCAELRFGGPCTTLLRNTKSTHHRAWKESDGHLHGNVGVQARRAMLALLWPLSANFRCFRARVSARAFGARETKYIFGNGGGPILHTVHVSFSRQNGKAFRFGGEVPSTSE